MSLMSYDVKLTKKIFWREKQMKKKHFSKRAQPLLL